MGNFLTSLFARERPKWTVRNFRAFRRLGFRLRCFAALAMKLLPLSFKIIGSSASPHCRRGHLNQLRLILI